RPAVARTRARWSGRARARDRDRNSTGEASRKLDDQSNAVACPAALREIVAARALEESGACHVDVRPRPVAGELAQELGGQDRRALPEVRRVLEVGEGRVDVAAIARMKGKGPGMVAALFGRVQDLLQPVLVIGK